jgi:hypothetical protein
MSMSNANSLTTTASGYSFSSIFSRTTGEHKGSTPIPEPATAGTSLEATVKSIGDSVQGVKASACSSDTASKAPNPPNVSDPQPTKVKDEPPRAKPDHADNLATKLRGMSSQERQIAYLNPDLGSDAGRPVMQIAVLRCRYPEFAGLPLDSCHRRPHEDLEAKINSFSENQLRDMQVEKFGEDFGEGYWENARSCAPIEVYDGDGPKGEGVGEDPPKGKKKLILGNVKRRLTGGSRRGPVAEERRQGLRSSSRIRSQTD